MSKIIEALKAHARDLPKGPLETKEKTPYELTQEQLADIYFSGTSKALQKHDNPVIIKVIERPRMASLIPWIITSVAFLITAFSLFSTKRVFVDIKVIDEKSPYLATLQNGAPSGEAALPRAAETQSPSEDNGAAIKLDHVKFEGAARLRSAADNTSLKLVNSSVSPFAQASVQLVPSADLSGSKIIFYAKGGSGGEKLAFAMKDSANRQAFDKGRHFPFPDGLTTHWQKAEIPVSILSNGFDVDHVAALRFDFGSRDVDNQTDDTVFVRDLRIVPL